MLRRPAGKCARTGMIFPKNTRFPAHHTGAQSRRPEAGENPKSQNPKIWFVAGYVTDVTRFRRTAGFQTCLKLTPGREPAIRHGFRSRLGSLRYVRAASHQLRHMPPSGAGQRRCRPSRDFAVSSKTATNQILEFWDLGFSPASGLRLCAPAFCAPAFKIGIPLRSPLA
jgi:hypothetical protein